MSAGHSMFGENEGDGVGATGETSFLTSFLIGSRAVAEHCGKNLDWGNSQTCHIPFIIPSFRRQPQADLCILHQPGLQSEIENS